MHRGCFEKEMNSDKVSYQPCHTGRALSLFPQERLWWHIFQTLTAHISVWHTRDTFTVFHTTTFFENPIIIVENATLTGFADFGCESSTDLNIIGMVSHIGWYGSSAYLWKITFSINHQQWCFPTASISHYHYFELLSSLCGTTSSRSTVLHHLASKTIKQVPSRTGLRSLPPHLGQVHGRAWWVMDLYVWSSWDDLLSREGVLAGSILCSPLPVPVTLKPLPTETPSVHFSPVLLSAGSLKASLGEESAGLHM